MTDEKDINSNHLDQDREAINEVSDYKFVSGLSGSGEVEVTTVRGSSEREFYEKLSSGKVTSLSDLGCECVAIWDWDIKGELLYVQPFPENPDPYECSSPTTWAEIVHAEDRERLLEALRRFEESPATHFDCLFRLATTPPRWVRARDLYYVHDLNDTPTLLAGEFLDVAEGELAKNSTVSQGKPSEGDDDYKAPGLRRLSEPEEQGADAQRIRTLTVQCQDEFECLYNFSSLPAFAISADFQTVGVNRAMRQLLGISSREILGMSDSGLLGEWAGEGLQSLFRYVLRGESVMATSFACINGMEMPFIDHLFPQWDSKGRVCGIHGVRAPLPQSITNFLDSFVEKDHRSDSMRAVQAQVELAAQHDFHVLLMGESGTGKDYLARRIHELSRRSKDPFEDLNCAALPKDLVGTELFGHEAGAFTGAIARRRGVFELVNQGTLLLNEIGDMPLDLQPTLLTVLETRSYKRIGGDKTLELGARIIAATNHDLKTDVEEGRFRKDLYHRLTVFVIRVPALRERLGELPTLVENLIQKLAGELRLATVPQLDPLAMLRLREYPWPGNIRELRNVLERTLILLRGSLIGPDDIAFEAENAAIQQDGSPKDATLAREGISCKLTAEDARVETSKAPAPLRNPSEEQIRALHEEYIVCRGGNSTDIAKACGTKDSTVRKWCNKYGLSTGPTGRPRKKRAD